MSLPDDVIDEALTLYRDFLDLTYNSPQFYSKRPSLIIAGIIYSACVTKRYKLTQKEVAREFDTQEVTIRQYSKMVKDTLVQNND